MKYIKSALPYVAVVLAVILIRTFIISPVTVLGESMEPTLYPNDYMLLNKFAYYFSDIKRFDIIVIQRENDRIIKRVVGLPGEHIKYEDNILYVNNKKVEEQYTRKEIEDFSLEDIGVDIIPENMYLVLGDNRPISLDSRVFGLVPKDKILGSASLVVFPFHHFGIKE